MNKFNLLKYLSKWKYLIFAVCVLGALIVYKYAMYNQEYTASTVISYTGQNAADGKTPSGDDIDVTEIYSAAVITNVLEDLNLNIGADAIRSKCKVTEIIPPDEEVKNRLFWKPVKNILISQQTMLCRSLSAVSTAKILQEPCLIR